MATQTEPTLAEANPLDDSLQKFLAGPKKLTDPGVIAYDPGAPADPTAISTFRPSISDVASDVVTLNQDPGLGYTQAEQWANEQAIAAQATADAAQALTAQQNAEQLALQQAQFDIDSRQANYDFGQKVLADKKIRDADSIAAAAQNKATFGKGKWATQPQFTQLPANYTPSGRW